MDFHTFGYMVTNSIGMDVSGKRSNDNLREENLNSSFLLSMLLFSYHLQLLHKLLCLLTLPV